MKQVAQNYRTGELFVVDVPPPECKAGGVLVSSLFSLISTGTEMMKVEEAKLSLVGKARARPDQLRKVMDTAVQVGPVEAYKRALSRLDSYTPLGYSLCGVVIDVGRGADDFAVGQLVACAGNEHALHAERNWVPTNLCVPVGPGVRPEHAAFATVGAIALQGVRRAEAQLGETALVIGLGLVGQLTVQLLVAAGVNVVGLDPLPDRCRIAEAAGARACATPDPDGIEQMEKSLAAMNGGLGADHLLITAAGDSNDPVHIAARLARDRARVVDVGKCRLDLPWDAYYAKELDVRFSRSYGPGRYDDRYELGGIDYPAGYVRWTERRNLACFVDLLERGSLDLDLVLSGTFPVDQAVDVYERLAAHTLTGVGFLFEYPRPHAARATDSLNGSGRASRIRREPLRPIRSPGTGTLRVGFIGAGNYASSMLLPHLRDDEHVELARVATSRSLSALNAQRKFGFVRASTGAESVLDDDDIDVVFIATRHHSHAALTCEALERGKAVFVEKPLALSLAELDRVLDVVSRTGNDRLMVGFNRRFSPIFVDLKRRFASRSQPGSARYLVNAGRLDAGSWYANADLEGSRFAGEGGHFIDTLSWWFDSEPTDVFALRGSGNDDLDVTLRFSDGSIATIAYVTSGNARFAKETFDAAAGGRSARLDNFRRASVWSGRRRAITRVGVRIDKGQRAELRSFLDAMRAGRPAPIPIASLAATTRGTLAVERSLGSGSPERL
jgi:predicted dehydrogenase/threonine dehydrogenase-like Zn-dependent dehydrogenase